jgi:hypothetical protein
MSAGSPLSTAIPALEHAEQGPHDGSGAIYGWVASQIEPRALQVVAENTPGVRGVEDRIHSVPLTSDRM